MEKGNFDVAVMLLRKGQTWRKHNGRNVAAEAGREVAARGEELKWCFTDNDTVRTNVAFEKIVKGLTVKDLMGDDSFKSVAWTYLLLYGGVDDQYATSGYSMFEADAGVYHLLQCGINRSKSSTPSVDEWSSFHDTYQNVDNEGLTSSMVCRCGKANIVLKLKAKSTSGLIRKLSSSNPFDGFPKNEYDIRKGI